MTTRIRVGKIVNMIASKQKNFFSLLAALIIGVSLFIVFRWREQSKLADNAAGEALGLIKEGDIFPFSTELLDLDGKAQTMDFIKGKVVIINYWAAWCSPCIREMPSLYKLQQKWKDRGLVVLALSMDDNPQQAAESLKRMAGVPTFNLYRGQNTAMGSIFPIDGLPFSVILDRSGKIQYAQAGEVDWSSREASLWIEKLL